MHATMEHMTIWGLISDASLLVKAVMITLLLASLLSWYLIIQRGSVLRRLERQLNGFVQRFRAASDLQPLYRETVQAGEGGIAPIFIAGVQEYQHLHSHDPAVLEGVERALQVAITEQEIELEKGLQFLATVGSVSPVHRFVWHGVGDHEFLYRFVPSATGHVVDSGAGHCRSADRHSHRPVCSHPGGDRL